MDEETINFIIDYRGWENKKDVTINQSIPKFDVVSNFDFREILEDLGVTNCIESSVPVCNQWAGWSAVVCWDCKSAIVHGGEIEYKTKIAEGGRLYEKDETKSVCNDVSGDLCITCNCLCGTGGGE